MLGTLCYARQARTLLRTARSASDAKLVTTLISKASDLKERNAPASRTPDLAEDGLALRHGAQD